MLVKTGFTAPFILIFLVLFSCSGEKSFREKKCERTAPESVKIEDSLMIEQLTDTVVKSSEIQKLAEFIADFNAQKETFDLDAMEKIWVSVKNNQQINSSELPVWTETTGLLLELTSDAKYAVELQKIADVSTAGSNSVSDKIYAPLVPFIFTKNTDHININLFANASLEYQHSLGGKVKIMQEVVSPSKVLIRFSMEEKRTIELNILIPAESQNPSVVEKNVKYVANPGEYCLVARKWGNGDVVEVNL